MLLLVIICIVIIKCKPFKVLKFSPIEEKISEIKSRRLFLRYSKYINADNFNVLSLIIFYISYFLLNRMYNSTFLSIVQALPVVFLPYVFSSIVIQIERYKILKILPNFCINIKNQLVKDNNIVLAIKNVKVLSPLKKYIDSFVVNVNNSMEVSTAFSVLKKQVDINEFSQLISLFQICYQNGGEFINVLEKYIKFLLNKISNKEKEKQDANSSILILIIMGIMSIFILLFYIIKNNENKTLMLSTGIGNAILLINIFSYIYCFWAIFKIYRME